MRPEYLLLLRSRTFSALASIFWVMLAMSSAHAACSSDLRAALINEYYTHNPAFIEIYAPDPLVDMTNWQLITYTGDKAKDRYVISSNVGAVGGTYKVFNPPNNNAMTDDTVVLLLDASGNEVDLVRIGQNSVPNWYPTTCGTFSDTSPVTDPMTNVPLSTSGGPKGRSRMPDGGNWVVMPGTGSNSVETGSTTNTGSSWVAMTKSVDNLTPNVGSTVTFTITLTEQDIQDSGSITVTDVLPAELTYVSHSVSTGSSSFDSGSRTLTWSVAALNKGATITATLTATVDSSGSITNTVSADVVIPNGYGVIPLSASVTLTVSDQIDHVRFIYDDPNALTCQPKTLEVRACANAACDSLVNNSTINLLPAGGWTAGNVLSLVTGIGNAELSQTVANVAVTLGVSSTSPVLVPGGGARCFNSSGVEHSTCDITFRDAGLVFDVGDHIADTPQDVTVRAVRTDDVTQACIPAFANVDRSVAMYSSYDNPGAGTHVVTVDGTPLPTTSPGANVLLRFDAAAEAVITLRYPDVGGLTLSAEATFTDGSGVTRSLSGISSFVVRPADFVISNVVRTSNGAANPGAVDAGGAVFLPAGIDFSLTVTAINANGNATPNFGRESPGEGVRLQPDLVGGLGLTNNPTITNGSIGGGAFTGGIATVTNLSWGEVGVITLTARVADGNYLDSGDVIGAPTGNVGRFVPYQFAVTANTPSFATQCTGSANPFSYMGASFSYASGLAPRWVVTAQGFSGATTQNYSGAWMKISNASLTNRQYVSGSGTLDTSGLATPDPVINDLGNGQAALEFSAGSGLVFLRNSPSDPFDAEIEVAVDVRDDDGVIYDPTQPVNNGRFSVGGTSPGSGIAFDSGNTFRWGRLTLGNAFGPELLPLDLPLAIEYQENIAGISTFVVNSDDGCSSLAVSDFQLSGYTGNLNAGETAVSTIALSSGAGVLTLAAPLAGNDGSVIASGLVPNVPDYLLFDWDGDGLHDNPASGLATFGIYAGSDRLIFKREAF